MVIGSDSIALRTEAYDATHRVRILPISRIGVENCHDRAEKLEPRSP